MNLSYEARLVSGITLLTIPTVMYGGFRWLVYFGALDLAAALIRTGIGVVRNLRAGAKPA